MSTPVVRAPEPDLPAAPAAPLALETRRIGKRFGGAVALEDGSFSLRPGEVHVLLGANGCGKSTLCRIIAGSVAPDSGEVFLAGRPVRFSGPAAARAAGVAAAYQETSLVPTLTVAENLLLGDEPMRRRGLPLVDRRARRDRARALIAEFGPAEVTGFGPDDFVADLRVDQRQIVEILKAVAQDPSILLFDEATASLDKSQVAAFFDLVRQLQGRGKSVVFISHRMEEVFAVGDRITVLRNGLTVTTLSVAATTKEEVITHMVGGASTIFTRQHRERGNEVVLEVRDLGGARLHDVSFQLHRGEVLGLGGLHGQGQSDLLRSLFGAGGRVAGTIRLGDQLVRLPDPPTAIRQGVAYLSGDRARAGVFGGRSILENLGLSVVVRQRRSLVRPAALLRLVRPFVEELKLSFTGFAQRIETLSGGNQQKVILSRWLATRPRILLLDDPTKGVDIQTKWDLYALMERLCQEGCAILLYSSEDAELLGNADRVLVFNGGRIVTELTGERLTEHHLYAAALTGPA